MSAPWNSVVPPVFVGVLAAASISDCRPAHHSHLTPLSLFLSGIKPKWPKQNPRKPQPSAASHSCEDWSDGKGSWRGARICTGSVTGLPYQQIGYHLGNAEAFLASPCRVWNSGPTARQGSHRVTQLSQAAQTRPKRVGRTRGLRKSQVLWSVNKRNEEVAILERRQ